MKVFHLPPAPTCKDWLTTQTPFICNKARLNHRRLSQGKPRTVGEEEEKKYKTLEGLPGVGPATAKKLREIGFNTIESLATATIRELSSAGVGEKQAAKIIEEARNSITLQFVHADELLKMRENVTRLKTGSRALDELLGGGLETQTITEFYGEYGSGKSQMCHQLCVNVQLPQDGGGLEAGALYIDTENSLPYDETILIVKNGVYEYRKIGEIVEAALANGKSIRIGGTLSTAYNPEHLQIVGFDPEDYKVKAFEITGFMKHPAKEIYLVRFASGRRVKVTKYHNFFTLCEEGSLTPTSIKELEIGSSVVVPSKLPTSNKKTVLDLAELIGGHRVNGFFVRGGSRFQQFIKENSRKLRKIVAEFDLKYGNVDNWKSRGCLPLKIYLRLKDAVNEEIESELLIGGRSKSNNLPLKIEAEPILLKFLATYVAEGSTTEVNNRVIITTSNEKVKKWIYNFGKKYGLHIQKAKNGFDLIVTSKVLVSLLHSLGIGNNAYQKIVPSFVLGLPEVMKKTWLEGYVQGDGSYSASTGQINCETVCDDLAATLLYLTTSIGIPARNCEVTRRYRGNRYVTHNVHWTANPVKNSRLEYLPSPVVGSILREARREAGLSMKHLASALRYGIEGSIWQVESGHVRKVGRKKIRKIISELKKHSANKGISNLEALLDGDIWFDEVVSIEKIGFELTYDVEVMPENREVENFVAGHGGVFLHNTFRPERIVQMARHMDLDPTEVIKRIIYAQAYTSDHQILLIEKADKIIKENNIRLIVVDSLTADFRSEYIGRETLAERQQKLNKHMHRLFRLAQAFNSVAVVTNQVMSKPDAFFGDKVEAIGGHIVAHTSHTRVFLRRATRMNVRIGRLVSSPYLPEGERIFKITENGIEDIVEEDST